MRIAGEEIMKLKVLSSLEKVFFDVEPQEFEAIIHSAFKNEVYSFQISAHFTGVNVDVREDWFKELSIDVQSDIADIVRIRNVRFVPSNMPVYSIIDDNYLDTTRTQYPDILEDTNNKVHFVHGRWNTLWIDVSPTIDTKAGEYPITFYFRDKNNEAEAEITVTVTILDACLPKQTLKRTEWFYTDCLADFYGVAVFSDRFWEIVRNFMTTAVARGINMVLTPVFTYALDTYVGGERTSVQLVGIEFDGEFNFDFTKLEKWIDMALEVGYEYIEISHLFTQWGAEHAPKIEVNVNGRLEKMFGWQTIASSDEYVGFLTAFLTSLRSFLQSKGVENKCYFHISDEPEMHNLEQYTKTHHIVSELLEGCTVFDAFSEPEFYRLGLVKMPVVGTNYYERFEDLDIQERWVYYCCGQSIDVSNRFMSMPSARTRIIGVQLYLYGIKGFLHWGFNFYNSGLSKRKINPYLITDADNYYPSGDPFSVYPGLDGKPVESLRLMVVFQAMQDLRALQMLESLKGRDFVSSLIYENFNEAITFKVFPKSQDYIIKLRSRVNEEIMRFHKN